MPSALRPWIRAVLACAFCAAAGFIAGRWSAPVPVLEVGKARPRPEVDLSPAGERRTVIAPKIVNGTPQAPPAAVPKAFGHQVATTSTRVPALPEGGLFQSATFARLDGRAVELRTVEWLETPQGRATLGDARTVAAPVRLVLPPPPKWGAALLVPVGEGRQQPGGLVLWTPGPFVLGTGYVQGHSFVIAGGRW